LEYLRLSPFQNGYSYADEDWGRIGKLAKLRELKISNHRIAAENLQQIVNLPNLKKLSLESPAFFTGEFVELAKMRCLTHLTIQTKEKIETADFRGLKALPRLAAISLEDSPFQPALLVDLPQFPALREIRFQVTEEMTDQLESCIKKMPRMKWDFNVYQMTDAVARICRAAKILHKIHLFPTRFSEDTQSDESIWEGPASSPAAVKVLDLGSTQLSAIGRLLMNNSAAGSEIPRSWHMARDVSFREEGRVFRSKQ
jgi:hypothetical protein